MSAVLSKCPVSLSLAGESRCSAPQRTQLVLMLSESRVSTQQFRFVRFLPGETLVLAAETDVAPLALPERGMQSETARCPTSVVEVAPKNSTETPSSLLI